MGTENKNLSRKDVDETLKKKYNEIFHNISSYLINETYYEYFMSSSYKKIKDLFVKKTFGIHNDSLNLQTETEDFLLLKQLKNYYNEKYETLKNKLDIMSFSLLNHAKYNYYDITKLTDDLIEKLQLYLKKPIIKSSEEYINDVTVIKEKDTYYLYDIGSTIKYYYNGTVDFLSVLIEDDPIDDNDRSIVLLNNYIDNLNKLNDKEIIFISKAEYNSAEYTLYDKENNKIDSYDINKIYITDSNGEIFIFDGKIIQNISSVTELLNSEKIETILREYEDKVEALKTEYEKVLTEYTLDNRKIDFHTFDIDTETYKNVDVYSKDFNNYYIRYSDKNVVEYHYDIKDLHHSEYKYNNCNMQYSILAYSDKSIEFLGNIEYTIPETNIPKITDELSLTINYIGKSDKMISCIDTCRIPNDDSEINDIALNNSHQLRINGKNYLIPNINAKELKSLDIDSNFNLNATISDYDVDSYKTGIVSNNLQESTLRLAKLYEPIIMYPESVTYDNDFAYINYNTGISAAFELPEKDYEFNISMSIPNNTISISDNRGFEKVINIDANSEISFYDERLPSLEIDKIEPIKNSKEIPCYINIAEIDDKYIPFNDNYRITYPNIDDILINKITRENDTIVLHYSDGTTVSYIDKIDQSFISNIYDLSFWSYINNSLVKTTLLDCELYTEIYDLSSSFTEKFNRIYLEKDNNYLTVYTKDTKDKILINNTRYNIDFEIHKGFTYDNFGDLTVNRLINNELLVCDDLNIEKLTEKVYQKTDYTVENTSFILNNSELVPENDIKNVYNLYNNDIQVNNHSLEVSSIDTTVNVSSGNGFAVLYDKYETLSNPDNINDHEIINIEKEKFVRINNKNILRFNGLNIELPEISEEEIIYEHSEKVTLNSENNKSFVIGGIEGFDFDTDYKYNLSIKSDKLPQEDKQNLANRFIVKFHDNINDEEKNLDYPEKDTIFENQFYFEVTSSNGYLSIELQSNDKEITEGNFWDISLKKSNIKRLNSGLYMTL